MSSLAYALSLLPLLAGPASAILDGIDARDVYEEMEHIFVDNSGTNSDGFIGAVTPCSNYFQDRTGVEGEQSSAQWVRLVFHDFVTANITEGTGGLDGSIAYEGNRMENPGLFVNDTLGFMFPTITAYLSTADNIALGIVAAVSTCNGSAYGIPLRVGRVDALEAGPSGVPEPTTDLETTLAQFEAAGFSQADAIASTACGHSLGRIHYSNFPTIVAETVVTTNNTHGGVGFDTTPAIFDSAVINEYLDGTGNAGGLLVTAPDEGDRSDLRLYASDNNATMQTLAENEAFRDTCYSLFERMINTVPAGVELSDPVVPMTWKGVDLGMDVSSAGVVSLSGMIRYLYTSGTPNTTVPYSVTTAAGNSSKTSGTKAGNGTSLFGSTYYWDFNTTLESGTTAVNFGNVSYPVNDDLFMLPYQSKATSNGAQSGNATIRAAVRTELVADDSATVMLYVPKRDTSSRAVVINVQNVTMSEVKTAGNYTIFEASAKGTFSTGSGVIMKVISGENVSRTIKIDLFNSA